MTPAYYRLKEAAFHLGLDPRTLKKHAERGELKGINPVRVGRNWMFPAKEILERGK